MAKKIAIIIEDDWELNGNGTGNVAELQYLPCEFLLRLARTYGFRISFMVEVLQQLAYRRYANEFEDLRIQADLWDACVLRMKSEGHDVQLHIHPQWYRAAINTQGQFLLSRQWNIAAYDSAPRREILTESIRYLDRLLAASGSCHRIHSFKAGAWAIQPSAGILRDLEAVGIRIVLGIGKGLHIEREGLFVDYRGLECTDRPYYPEYDDVCKVSSVRTNIIVCPLAYHQVRYRDVLLRCVRKIQERMGPDPTEGRATEIPPDVKTFSLVHSLDRVQSVRPLDIGANPLGEMIHAFRRIVQRSESVPGELVPVVLQTHSKKFHGNWRVLTSFFRYITSEYRPRIVFLTLSELLPYLDGIALLRGDWHAESGTSRPKGNVGSGQSMA